MKRMLLLTIPLILCAISSYAATVSGKVSFLTKRGQKPNLTETMVWLEPLKVEKMPKAVVPTVPLKMTTRSKVLLPHVLAVPVGGSVQFPNEDPITHNLFSLSPSNSFDLGLYRKGGGKTFKFSKPGIVNVYCNVHPNMSAVIHVLKTPYHTTPASNGTFELSDVAAGKYKLIAWNEQGGSTFTEVQVAANGTLKGNTVLTIDSRTYRSGAHTNKFGRAYESTRPKDY